MDNNKDKDFQVKNDAFNDDLREALRRREAKRPQVEVPADFLDSVMQQVGPDRTHAKAKTWRIALASLAIAACTLTAVLLVWPRGDEKQSDVSELIVRKERTHHQPSSDIHPASIVTTPAPKKTHIVKVKKQVSRQDAPYTESVNESDNYMAELEKGLADVRDSCYLAQVERMIADNEELQKLMNDMTNKKQ